VKITVSVINDLSFDQRVHKMCTTLEAQGYDILLIGRKQKSSVPLSRSYRTKRMKLIFEKGALFYAFFNFRLFCVLLFTKTDVYHSNDLDTLLPNFLASRIKRKPLIYDSHEYFTGVPEIQNKKFVKWVWVTIEKTIFPKLNHIYTVNDSIANLYEKDYDNRPAVIRNIPNATKKIANKTRTELNIAEDQNVLILQGAGINVDRGAEELLEAMVNIKNTILIIIGNGDVIDQLKSRAVKNDLRNKVIFKEKMDYSKMMEYTQVADIGLTLDKDTNINYKYSLPNKVFDYIRAGIPVISTPIIEVKNVINKYQVGAITPSCTPLAIAETINTLLDNSELRNQYKINTIEASNQLSWENEVIEIVKVYKSLQIN
jgi:glycosyltransferase involved in cell wall biosynthesis